MRKAFTLIEIVIGISVVAVLSAFAVGNYSSVTSDAKLVKIKNDLDAVRKVSQQYIAKTEAVPIENGNVGVHMSKLKLKESEYIMVNLDLFIREFTLEDGVKVPAYLSKVPDSSKYLKAGMRNAKSNEPSFIYVMDSNYNIYLAEGERDEATGYFINTRIYETKNANLYEKKYKMNYESNVPILENLDQGGEIEFDDAVDVPESGNVIIPPQFLLPNPIENGEETGPDEVSIFYTNSSIAGFNLFVEIPNIDFSTVSSMRIKVTAGGKIYEGNMYTIRSTMWFARINSEDLNYFSGNYKCEVSLIPKTGNKATISSFNVLVDRTKPTLVIEKSRTDFYVENPISISFKTTDTEPSSGINYIEYKLNNGEWVEYKKPFNLNSDYYEIQARCIDNFGNTSDIVTTLINDYTKPEVYLTKTNTGVKIDIGADVFEEDILWQNGFEVSDNAVNLNQTDTIKYGPSGGQSITTLEKFQGERAYELLKNNDGNGNEYFAPNTSGTQSRLNLGVLSKIIKNDMYLAVGYRYKSFGTSIIRPIIAGTFSKKIYYYNIKIIEDALAGTSLIKLDSVTGLSFGASITSDTEDSKVIDLPKIQSIDSVAKTITLTAPLKRTIKSGENLAYRIWRNGGNFQHTTTNGTNNEWMLVTSITKTSNFSDYDLYTHGIGGFMFLNTSSDRLYIDNIKMGFAPKIRLYKNGIRYNSADQEYTTSYTDNNIPDKEAPKISNIKVGEVNSNYTMEVEAKDFGTVYTYYTESISTQGNISISKSRSITSTSGISKYYYVIDNNANTGTVPKNDYSADSVINKTLDKNKAWYIHVIAEDKSGNVSGAFHKKIN